MKLNWAKHRIGEFEWIMKNYENSKPIIIKYTDTQIILEREKRYPEEMPLVLGDAIHNLRTSLDLLASDVVRLNGGSSKEVYFPFAPNAAELENQIKRKNFNRAAPAAVNLLRQIAPHREGNKHLRGLHDLDVMDKHQLILPVFHVFKASKLRVEGPMGHIELEISVPGDGASINKNPGDSATVKAFECVVGFGEGAPSEFRGFPVVEVLQNLSQLVGGIIKSFRDLLSGGDKAASGPVSDDGAIKSV